MDSYVAELGSDISYEKRCVQPEIDLGLPLIQNLKSVIITVLEDHPHPSQLWTARPQALHQAGSVYVSAGHPEAAETSVAQQQPLLPGRIRVLLIRTP